MTVDLIASFRRALLQWYEAERRDLPWRKTTDFYPVWVSEIMLQQTRVEAVIPYYLQFLERFPTVNALAAALEPDVLAAWSGLGYYSRARHLHRAARLIVDSGLPVTHSAVAALPGAGSYTASAIASIVLGLPHAALDGNVIRVISRVTNDSSEVSSPVTRRRFGQATQELLDPARPGDFNQAMMELGATICKPRVPMCDACPLQPFCAAHRAGTQRELPVKLKKQKARDLHLNLMLFRRDAQVYLVQRHASEIRLAGFWELPGKELFPLSTPRLCAEFSHQIVNDRFHVTVWVDTGQPDPDEGRWMQESALHQIPLATITRKALAAVPLLRKAVL